MVETGVARGFTTRVILEAMEGNDRVVCTASIFLRRWTKARLADETGAAVAIALPGRWTLIEGSSRRRLPGLLRELGRIDLFVHDSRHTRRNIMFELQAAWRALRPGGFMVADDVHRQQRIRGLSTARRAAPAIVCASDDQRGQFGLIEKPGR